VKLLNTSESTYDATKLWTGESKAVLGAARTRLRPPPTSSTSRRTSPHPRLPIPRARRFFPDAQVLLSDLSRAHGVSNKCRQARHTDTQSDFPLCTQSLTSQPLRGPTILWLFLYYSHHPLFVHAPCTVCKNGLYRIDRFCSLCRSFALRSWRRSRGELRPHQDIPGPKLFRRVEFLWSVLSIYRMFSLSYSRVLGQSDNATNGAVK
jgi:hypothetical protein